MWLIPNTQNYTHILVGGGGWGEKTPKVPINCSAIRLTIKRVNETLVSMFYLCFPSSKLTPTDRM
jgi:hypothetical protein